MVCEAAAMVGSETHPWVTLVVVMAVFVLAAIADKRIGIR